MSKNMRVHINHMAILLAPEQYSSLIREYLSQKLLQNVQTEFDESPVKYSDCEDQEQTLDQNIDCS